MSRQLSLRTRLLLAVGAIALLALAVADVTVYTSLKSYLYHQADSTLQLSHASIEQAANEPAGFAANGPSAQQPGEPLGGSNFCAIGPREWTGDVHRGSRAE